MSGTGELLATGPPVLMKEPGPRPAPAAARRLLGSDLVWAIAFVLPYAAVFLAFAIYPILYALWLAGKPSLYAALIDDPLYLTTVLNTLLFVGIGGNLTIVLAVV